MKRQLVGSLCCAATILCALSLSGRVRAETPVDIELVIAADVSLSMDQEEKQLQQEGFVEAFRDPDVLDAIRSGGMGRIAVTYFEWGGHNRHRIVIPWTIIDGPESAEHFARRLETNRPARFNRGTSLASALLRSRQLLQERGGSATRRVINISGDGRDNGELELARARSVTLAGEVTINGLPIVYKGLMEGIVTGTTQREVDPRLLTNYFERQVIGGQFAFVEPVVARENYADAIRRKLIREIRAPMFAGLGSQSGN
jgi:hypothetical protein